MTANQFFNSQDYERTVITPAASPGFKTEGRRRDDYIDQTRCLKFEEFKMYKMSCAEQ
jgi:hypothetical protein